MRGPFKTFNRFAPFKSFKSLAGKPGGSRIKVQGKRIAENLAQTFHSEENFRLFATEALRTRRKEC
jgi:hypothetical protein